MKVESHFGWEKTLVLENDFLEVIVTLEVGPRILSFRRRDSENVLGLMEDQLGQTGESDFRLRGGHRLWLAPENAATYFADNHPVALEQPGENQALLKAPPESKVQKTMELELHDNELRIVHRLTALVDFITPVAAWALTILRPGGLATVPQPLAKAHPGHADENNEAAYLPDRHLSLWSYTDINDSRITWANPVMIEQRAQTEPLKLGFLHRESEVHYEIGADRFTKTVAFDDNATYPDGNCNLEVYTDSDILELETLSPLTVPTRGETLVHKEVWRITPR